MLNGAQTLKGALHHDGQPGTQGLTFFHAVRQERGGEGCGDSHLSPAPLRPLGIPCLWDVRTTALPSLMMLTMEFHSMRRAWGSMPVVGSSCGEAKRAGATLGASLHRLLHPPWLTSSECCLCQTVHHVTPQWGETWDPGAEHRRQVMNQESEVKSYTPFHPRNGLRLNKAMVEFL